MCSLLVLLNQWRSVCTIGKKWPVFCFPVKLTWTSQQDHTRFWLERVISITEFFFKPGIFFITRFSSNSLNLDISTSRLFYLADVLVMEPSKLLRPLLCYHFLFNSVFFSPLQNQARLPSCSSTYSVSEVYFARVFLHSQHARPHHFSYFIFLLP